MACLGDKLVLRCKVTVEPSMGETRGRHQAGQACIGHSMPAELLRRRFDNALARSGGIGLGSSHLAALLRFDNFCLDHCGV
jgi:hypothetical protein